MKGARDRATTKRSEHHVSVNCVFVLVHVPYFLRAPSICSWILFVRSVKLFAFLPIRITGVKDFHICTRASHNSHAHLQTANGKRRMSIFFSYFCAHLVTGTSTTQNRTHKRHTRMPAAQKFYSPLT